MGLIGNIKTLVKLQRDGKLADAIDLVKKMQDTESSLNQLAHDVGVARVRFGNVVDSGVRHALNVPNASDNSVLHSSFSDVYRIVAAGCSPFLVGPAGSGKSTVLEQVAKSMNLDFYPMSVNALTSDYNIIGYNDANGRYVSSAFRDAYEKGGLFSFEEIDAGNPNVMTVINNAMSQNQYLFPDKIVKKHPKFVMAASGNTYGTGANIQYVGRNSLDAATLDRFVTVYVDYDNAMEERLCGDKDWLNFVRSVRNIVNSQGMKFIVSTRAVLDGARLINAGMAPDKVAKMVVFKGMAQSDIDNIYSAFENGKTR
ncbi:MAG: AAA family ATPase [Muribaculaceae bacterium]|nr:AAA family ATPase [Muribaculaceae bacterium]